MVCGGGVYASAHSAERIFRCWQAGRNGGKRLRNVNLSSSSFSSSLRPPPPLPPPRPTPPPSAFSFILLLVRFLLLPLPPPSHLPVLLFPIRLLLRPPSPLLSCSSSSAPSSPSSSSASSPSLFPASSLARASDLRPVHGCCKWRVRLGGTASWRLGRRWMLGRRRSAASRMRFVQERRGARHGHGRRSAWAVPGGWLPMCVGRWWGCTLGRQRGPPGRRAFPCHVCQYVRYDMPRVGDDSRCPGLVGGR